jgi:uncharacterized protein (DUF169 family)
MEQEIKPREKSDSLKMYSVKLQQTLHLDGSPVAVAIGTEPPEKLPSRRKMTACMMVQIARRGAACYSSGNNILCGGRANLGLGRSPLRKLDDFLVRKEKLFRSRDSARRLLNSIEKHAPDKGSFLAFSPLEEAHFIPDVVLFVGTPELISRIIFLNAFEDGDMETIHGEPLCSGVIGAPITTGKPGISFLDRACRSFGRYRPEEMIIGVPYRRLPLIVNSIELSSAGTAKPDFILGLAESVLKSRVPHGST